MRFTIIPRQIRPTKRRLLEKSFLVTVTLKNVMQLGVRWRAISLSLTAIRRFQAGRFPLLLLQSKKRQAYWQTKRLTLSLSLTRRLKSGSSGEAVFDCRFLPL